MSSPFGDHWSRSQRSLAALIVLAAVVGMVWMATRPDAPALWRSAQLAADQQQWNVALTYAERAIRAATPSASELASAGSMALKSGQSTRAAELFAQIRDNQSGAGDAHRRAGMAWLSAGSATPAEREFRQSLRLDPQNDAARTALCELLRLSGRYFELESLICELIAVDRCPSALLFAVAWPDKAWLDDEDRAVIEEYRQADPDAGWINMAASGVDALSLETRDAALQLVRKVAQGDSPPSEAFARWGTLLTDSAAWDQLSEWNNSLTPGALAHPQVWYVRGLWQLQQDHPEAAIRCFWEALERAPFHAGATYQLSQLLPRSSERDRSDVYAEQARLLAALRQQVIYGKGAGGFPGPDVLHKIVDLLAELGRDWEVLGWCQLASARHPQLRWPIDISAERRQRLTPDAPFVPESSRISRRVRLDQFPLPDFGTNRLAPSTPGSDDAHGIRFDEVASQRGLQFRYTNGSSTAEPHGYMYEVSGGGVGVLDYDLDGWPDLYLSNGGPVLTLPRDPTITDRLFRNRAGREVQEVTTEAGVLETAYGQGVAVGDINSDGFPDLFVGNIGPNQLWINQGDGTFVDRTALAELSGSVWTMSAAVADLNGDGLADLYEANYVGGDAISQTVAKTCSRDGIPVQCRPTMFPAEPDRLWLNLGDGRMQDATQAAGVHIPAGKGIGVVVADFDGRGQLALYVANDMEPNAFFRNETAVRGDLARFGNDAVPLGLAFGSDGQPLASMGIGIDDIDRDGRLDLYVTNFLTEGSNLYVQDAAGTFTDRSRNLGIFEHSTPLMGWGAQFLDADLDGWPDLIVSNGHLEDYRRWNVASQMPTQVFRNLEGRRFELLTSDATGGYFQERYFGRTLAKFDGNRDGREDFLVTHVDAPVAWLQNATRDTGHFLAIRLAGTVSERDAIGTRLMATSTGNTWWKQLTAGDGFQASNQRQIVFGLGTATRVDDLQVDWPSGTMQRFADLPVDQEIVLIEGRSEWYPLSAAPSVEGASR